MSNKLIRRSVFKPISLLCLTAALVTTVSASKFSSKNGFFNDPLNGQKGWWADKGWNVDATKGYAICSKEWSAAVHGGGKITLPKSGDEITMRITFQFEGPVAAKDTPIFCVGFENTATYTSKDNTLIFCTSRAEGILQLRVDNNSKPLNPVAFLPIDKNGSDLLAIEYTLSIGSKPEDSVIFACLRNLTKRKNSVVGLNTGIDPSTYAAAKANGIYPTFALTQFLKDNQTITGVQIHSLEVVKASK